MLNDDAIAIYLLHFGHRGLVLPISPQGIFALLSQLYENGLTPSRLFSLNDTSIYRAAGLSLIESDGLKSIAQAYIPAKMDLKRLQAMEIEMLSVVDGDYPFKLKSKLKQLTPPVLFYSGDIGILSRKSIAVVGQRDASGDALRVAVRLGELCAAEGVTVVSGGAEGVDKAAQSGVLLNGGFAAVFYPCCLSLRVNHTELAKWRDDGRLLMLSHARPFDGFSAQNALARNRFIHCGGDFSVAVSTKLKKGGTWAGVCDNLRNGFSPQFVCNLPVNGNKELIKIGAMPLDCARLWGDGVRLYVVGDMVRV